MDALIRRQRKGEGRGQRWLQARQRPLNTNDLARNSIWITPRSLARAHVQACTFKAFAGSTAQKLAQLLQGHDTDTNDDPLVIVSLPCHRNGCGANFTCLHVTPTGHRAPICAQVPIELIRVLPESLDSHAVCHVKKKKLDTVVTYTNAPTPTPRAQIGGVYFPFIPSTNEGFSCTSNCVGKRAYHCQAVMWRIHDQQIKNTHSFHSPSLTPKRWHRCHLHSLVLRVSLDTLALLSNPLCRTFTGDFE